MEADSCFSLKWNNELVLPLHSSWKFLNWVHDLSNANKYLFANSSFEQRKKNCKRNQPEMGTFISTETISDLCYMSGGNDIPNTNLEKWHAISSQPSP